MNNIVKTTTMDNLDEINIKISKLLNYYINLQQLLLNMMYIQVNMKMIFGM